MGTSILAQPQVNDNQIFEHWTQQAELAIDGLFVFKAWLRAWQSHPLRGQLPAGLFEDVVKDMDKAGLMPWLDKPELGALCREVAGADATKWPVEAIEYAPTQAPPYGPPARTEVIDRWISRVDEVLITLEKYYSFLIEARGHAPEAVDGVKLVNMENDVHAICDGIAGYIDCDCENDLISNATGRSSSAVCVEAELRSDSHVSDRDFWQREVDAACEDHPHERTRLQAAFNAKYGGAL